MTGRAQFRIQENANGGTFVGSLFAFDEDESDQLLGDVVFSQQNEDIPFVLNFSSADCSSTGVHSMGLVVRDGTNLDFETISAYTFAVDIADASNPSLRSSMTVDVNLLDVNDQFVITDLEQVIQFINVDFVD